MVGIPEKYRGAMQGGARTTEQILHPLAGKVAFISGGTRGIGAGIATRLAEDGADIAVTYMSNATAAQSFAATIRALGRRAVTIQADAADVAAMRAAIDQTFDSLGRLDIIVNNAGYIVPAPLADYKIEDFDRTYQTNVRASLVTIQAALKYLPRGGRVINISSVVGSSYPNAMIGSSAYAMSKAALNQFSKAAARELGPLGITVNVIQPGPTATEGLEQAPLEFLEGAMSLCAIQQFAEPAEIGALAAFLAGPAASHVTGALYVMDSGVGI